MNVAMITAFFDVATWTGIIMRPGIMTTTSSVVTSTTAHFALLSPIQPCQLDQKLVIGQVCVLVGAENLGRLGRVANVQTCSCQAPSRAASFLISSNLGLATGASSPGW